MKKNIGLSVFVPVYNEEKIIEANLRKLESKVKEITNNYDITIVDDSSTDNTSKISRKIARGKIKYLRFNNGPSRRENLAEAMKTGKKEVIVFTDIDLSADLKHLKELIEGMKKGDISTGSRYMGIGAKRTIFRKGMSIVYNTILRIMFNSKVRDHQCGFKAYKNKVIKGLIDDAGYDSKFIRGWFWDAEILIRAQKKGYKINEFPVEWERGKDSSFQLKRELRMIKYWFKLKQKL